MSKIFLLSKNDKGKRKAKTPSQPLFCLIRTCIWKCFPPKMFKGPLQKILQAELYIESQWEGDLALGRKLKNKYTYYLTGFHIYFLSKAFNRCLWYTKAETLSGLQYCDGPPLCCIYCCQRYLSTVAILIAGFENVERLIKH